MNYIHRCMIVPAAQVALARELVELLGGEAAERMFTTGLSATGDEPFTHYISSGMIDEVFGVVLSDPTILSQQCTGVGRAVTLLEATALLTACDITNEEPFAALARMELVLLTPEQLAARKAASA